MTYTITISKRTVAVLAAIVAVTVLAGCSLFQSNKASQPTNDAQRTGVNDTTPADVIAMPDGFGNLATKCVFYPDGHWDRYTTLFHGDSNYGSIAVTPDDPTCKGK